MILKLLQISNKNDTTVYSKITGILETGLFYLLLKTIISHGLDIFLIYILLMPIQLRVELFFCRKAISMRFKIFFLQYAYKFIIVEEIQTQIICYEYFIHSLIV